MDGDMQFAPATKDGMPVNSRLITGNFLINVKGYKAEAEELTGC